MRLFTGYCLWKLFLYASVLCLCRTKLLQHGSCTAVFVYLHTPSAPAFLMLTGLCVVTLEQGGCLCFLLIGRSPPPHSLGQGETAVDDWQSANSFHNPIYVPVMLLSRSAFSSFRFITRPLSQIPACIHVFYISSQLVWKRHQSLHCTDISLSCSLHFFSRAFISKQLWLNEAESFLLCFIALG